LRDVIDQIEQSLQTRLYYLSLFAALAVPDIAGALEAPDGQANGDRYAAWYEQWARPRLREEAQKDFDARAGALGVRHIATSRASSRVTRVTAFAALYCIRGVRSIPRARTPGSSSSSRALLSARSFTRT
jgi:hypothetical protein